MATGQFDLTGKHLELLLQLLNLLTQGLKFSPLRRLGSGDERQRGEKRGAEFGERFHVTWMARA